MVVIGASNVDFNGETSSARMQKYASTSALNANT